MNAPMIPASWGEVLDKISILEIKQARITNPAALANVRQELQALAQVVAAALPASAPLDALRAALRQVNEALWDVEDALRDKERAQSFDEGFITLARSVYRLNDERARTKRQINELTRSALVEEKSYQPY